MARRGTLVLSTGRENQGVMRNKWTRTIMIALGAMIILALLIRVFFSETLQDLVH